jgi:hypothetical protein
LPKFLKDSSLAETQRPQRQKKNERFFLALLAGLARENVDLFGRTGDASRRDAEVAEIIKACGVRLKANR